MQQMTNSSRQLVATTPGPRAILVERVFDASRERVWRAFTERDLVKQWWGRGNELDIERFEVERGGHWRFIEHAGDQAHGFEGRFQEVSPIDRLVYTFEWDGMPGHTILNSVEFIDLGNGTTKLSTTATFFTEEERDGMLEAGMTSGLGQSYLALDQVLAALA